MASQTPQNQGLAGILIGTADALDRWLEIHRTLYLGVSCLLCVLANLGYAHYRAITSDECLQMIVLRQPNFQAIWDSLCAGVQVDPPVLDSVMHYLFGIFGEHLLLARLPSVFCFCLMCLCLALIVWRYASAIYGAAAFFVPFATVLRSWGSLARPYAPMLGFSALALMCWDRLQDARHPWRWRLALTLSLATTFSTHFFSIAILFPLLLGEITKWNLRKRIDWPALQCIAVGFIPWLVWSPVLIASSRTFLPHPGSASAFKTLYEFYGEMLFSLPWVGTLLMMLLACAVVGRSGDHTSPPMNGDSTGRIRAMIAVCDACLLLPVCGTLVSVVKPGAYGPRMALISIFGLIVGLPLLLAFAGARKAIALALFAAMAGNAAMVTAQGVLRLRGRDEPYPAFAEFRRLIPEPYPDIVMADTNDFLPFYEANQDDPESTLVYLFDPEKQLAVRGSDTPDVASRILQNRTRARILPFDPYVATHSHFYLLSGVDMVTKDEWQFKYLLAQMHARLGWLGNVRGWDLYSVDLAR